MTTLLGAAFAISNGVTSALNRPKFINTKPKKVLLLYLLIAIFSLIWSIDFAATVSSLTNLFLQILILILIANYIGCNAKRLNALLISVASGASLAALLGLINVGISSGNRISYFEGGDPAHFASSIVPAVMTALVIIMFNDSIGHKLYAIPIFIISTASILLSGTRSAWIGILIALIMFVLPLVKSKKLAYIIIFVFSVITLISYIPVTANFVSTRIDTANDTGGAGRTSIWVVGRQIALEHLPLGVGLGAFPTAFDNQAIFKSSLKSINSEEIYPGRAPHNIYLSNLSEVGIPGTALFILFLYSTMSSLWTYPRKKSSIIIYSVLIVYISQGFFLDVTNRKYFWLFLALAIGCEAVKRREREGSLANSKLSL
ncbi:O-antigen ligase family protein [Deinococcus detaillensis]|uniref:O-antigen ligase family protein n=1 Tax=Deinococcus detaillensis TaxID=2592048 RepID=UPI00163DE4D9|nr:O-antigen ligase family protein [Deinococcus detaillensis]